jgi:hypothetical protein
VQAFQGGDYATAVDKLGRAYQALKAPTLGLWLARSLAKSGKLVEAAERYLEVQRLDSSTGDVAMQKQAKRDAELERDELMPHIPGLLISVRATDPSDAEVAVDGVTVSSALLGERWPVNPGRHVVSAKRGQLEARQEVTVAEREERTVVLTLHAPSVSPSSTGSATAERQPEATHATNVEAPAPGPRKDAAPASDSGSTQRTLAFVGIGTGGASLVLGVVTGIMLGTKKDDLGCADTHCLVTQKSDVSSYNSLRTVSSIGFIAGAVLAVAGGALLATAPKKTSDAAGLSLIVDRDRVGLSGVF